MEDAHAALASAVLTALADLAPATEVRTPGLSVPTDWFSWLPVEAVQLFVPQVGEAYVVSVERDFGERLAAVDQIRTGERSLRVGWLFVAGRTTDDQGVHRVFHPLVTVPVRVSRPPGFGRARLLPAGDAEITGLVTDRDERDRFERHVELGGGALDGMDQLEIPRGLLPRLSRLQHFARSLAAGAGFPAAATVVTATDSPEQFMARSGLVIVAGVGVYAIREAGESSRASSLRSWAALRPPVWTGFHSLYFPADAPAPDDTIQPAVASPYLLTPVQQTAVAKSRTEPVTLVSGAPGTGKSHTIAAVACDALANGQRVLVAAKSDATVDALVELLDRGPGPDPIVFGSNERRQELAARLSAGQLQAVDEDMVESDERSAGAAASRRDEVRARVAALLRAELLVGRADPRITAGRALAPGLFAPDADLAALEALLQTAAARGRGWLARRRRRRALEQVRAITQSVPEVDPDELREALAAARDVQTAMRLEPAGGLDLAPLWTELLSADDEARRALGRWLANESRSSRRLNRSTLPAVGALATALRSGRSARREQLRKLDDDRLTRALPLWVGTLADVDDLLPPVAGLFDLVILDEASSIDQPLAATTLLRGRRAVIAGDPRQLRQVSFVSDADLHRVLEKHHVADDAVLAARLDVRRNSVFDLAAGASPVLVLNEHFRSHPHLVEFIARRLYDGRLLIATRSPETECHDCVDVVRTNGQRDESGVVRAEVQRTVAELKSLLRKGERSVGVVTPFRAQADAIEEAVLRAFTADDLEALDLRVGTAHAFQGNERETVIVSLGIGPAEGPATWRFVEDPHLFAVLLTRARRRLTLLLSADPPEGGLVADYLAQADTAPGPPAPAGSIGEWATAIADDLTAAGVPVIKAYPTGRHVVDVCIADEHRSTGIECEVHREGPDAHIDRHLALARAGWELLDAYRSRWGERRGELIVNLVNTLKGQGVSRKPTDS